MEIGAYFSFLLADKLHRCCDNIHQRIALLDSNRTHNNEYEKPARLAFMSSGQRVTNQF